MKTRLLLIGLVIVVCGSVVSLAQYRRYRGTDIRTARSVPSDNPAGLPEWTNAPGFDKDVFTFARIRYTSARGRGRWSNGGWETDLPDSDLNLSFRLQQVTSIKTDPDGRVINITDPELFDYPWIYIVEPGALVFLEEEVAILRNYLLNGGFLMFDDFWGESAWENVEEQMQRVLPERRFVELSLDHPIYHCVFPIKSKGQVPNMQLGDSSQFHGRTWEQPDAQEVHHRAILDDKGRIMVIATHNTDNGDGWEREGFSEYYFRNFSEKISYPLGINIIFYSMTH